jgi:hypothetical protein
MKTLEAKVKSIGRIHVMPRRVFWIGMPDSFKEKEKMELFQKDIWVIKHPAEDIKDLEKESEFILFINLDTILFAGRAILTMQEIPSATKLIQNINLIKPMHAIVHTTHISPNLKDLFTKASFTYIEKNLQDTTSAMSTVIKTVNYVYEKTNRTSRAFLRVEIDDAGKIPIKCTIENDKTNKMVDGHIGDLSLNGLQIKFNDEEKVNSFSLKDFIELSFMLEHHHVKIQKALITRIDIENKFIGVYFEIHNEKMVKEIYSRHFTDMLYTMIKEFLKD